MFETIAYVLIGFVMIQLWLVIVTAWLGVDITAYCPWLRPFKAVIHKLISALG
jgi:hypothetical protein